MVSGKFCRKETVDGNLFCRVCRKKKGVYHVPIRQEEKVVSKVLMERVKFPVYWDPARKVLVVNAGGTTQILGGWEDGVFIPQEPRELVKREKGKEK